MRSILLMTSAKSRDLIISSPNISSWSTEDMGVMRCKVMECNAMKKCTVELRFSSFNQRSRGGTFHSFIHSFIPDISIPPLHVHYYSALLTTARILCRKLTHRSATDNYMYGWRTCPRSIRGGYRVGFEPATFRTQGPKVPLFPVMCACI